ncbi:MAG: septation protein A [Rhodospirillales bacterium]
MTSPSDTKSVPSEKQQLIKLALEMGPLVLFFVINSMYGIFAGTTVLVVSTIVSLVASRIVLRRTPIMPLVGGSFILVFGILTLVFEDDTFIKIKPTIVNMLFASALATGLLLKRNWLKLLFESAFQLPDDIWRILTWRWAGFFVLLAVLNELVWRTQTTDFWVAFKVWGILPLTIVFSLTQLPLIMRHRTDQAPESGD